MADITRKTVDESVEMIARLHDTVATDPGDEREAAPAAANLWSGSGVWGRCDWVSRWGRG
jgi:hypothetical protein